MSIYGNKKEFALIWKLAEPHLKSGKRKNFVLHTKQVLKAMEMLLKNEPGDSRILIPAAILHDTGWSKVPVKLQKSQNKKDKIKALKLHIKYAIRIIWEILSKLKYSERDIKAVEDIVIAHKFQKPERQDKRMLIDADTLSDAFREQFYNDVKSYGNSPKENYKYRIQNKFYTKTARAIFKREMAQRKKEIFK